MKRLLSIALALLMPLSCLFRRWNRPNQKISRSPLTEPAAGAAAVQEDAAPELPQESAGGDGSDFPADAGDVCELSEDTGAVIGEEAVADESVTEVSEEPPVELMATATTGACGDNLTWSYNSETGHLTISGSGACGCSRRLCVFWGLPACSDHKQHLYH